MCTWIERYTYDFVKGCPELGEKVRTWLEGLVTSLEQSGDSSSSKVPKQVLQKLSRVTTGLGSLRETPDMKYPRPYLPKDPDSGLLETNLEEVARQITIVQWNLWKECKPWEFLGLSWTKSEDPQSSLLKLIKHFNSLSDWVAATICTTESPKKRSKILLKFLTLANHLKRINNLNGLLAILSGLQRGPLMRLKHTEELAKQKDQKTFELFSSFQELTSSTKSFSNLRNHIKIISPPYIPYVGMYLSDLTFIEEGNPDFLGEHKLINIFKICLISNTITEIRLSQLQPYLFIEVPSILIKLNQTPSLEEKKLYELSYYLETRDGRDPPTRPDYLVQRDTEMAKKTKKGNIKIAILKDSSQQIRKFGNEVLLPLDHLCDEANTTNTNIISTSTSSISTQMTTTTSGSISGTSTPTAYNHATHSSPRNKFDPPQEELLRDNRETTNEKEDDGSTSSASDIPIATSTSVTKHRFELSKQRSLDIIRNVPLTNSEPHYYFHHHHNHSKKQWSDQQNLQQPSPEQLEEQLVLDQLQQYRRRTTSYTSHSEPYRTNVSTNVNTNPNSNTNSNQSESESKPEHEANSEYKSNQEIQTLSQPVCQSPFGSQSQTLLQPLFLSPSQTQSQPPHHTPSQSLSQSPRSSLSPPPLFPPLQPETQPQTQSSTPETSENISTNTKKANFKKSDVVKGEWSPAKRSSFVLVNSDPHQPYHNP
eukprot:TRINITY_DN8537_c0_g1_i5.p1 TRINITY_DN8537_c0_g1~~TRINITY_DN8537_c0_g1_i5.p1  ORF type:complete len:708 (-),score=145.30 TRINITY_DN8537_c0_g1_i5:174-2297(-)